jgi:pimeloyl-ACP methyl ester carboxylesterase
VLAGFQRSGRGAEPQHGNISLRPCEAGGGRCGTYEVYEDRFTKTGRKISLNIVVIPALAGTPSPDPVFWLEGGPGGAAAQSAGPVSQRFLGQLRQDHDLVFVDQRGTGKSNPLKCDDIGENPADLDSYFGKIFPPNLIRACREKLEKAADLKLYTTPIAMDDLDDVRNALGYDRIDIVAASYGTLAAQVYMRQHPEHVRAAFLVGVVTPGFRLPLPFARAAQHALDFLFVDCAADHVCHDAFPNLKDEFDAVLARFDRGPLEVKMVDQAAHRMRPVKLERENYVEHLRVLLYSTASARFVPYLVHRAFLQDFIPFETMATQYNMGGSSTSRGMYFSVTCSESIPFITDAEIVSETRGTFLGDGRLKAHISACKEWPRGAVPPDFTDPLKSQIPVVMFSGEVDGSTPPWIAEAAAKLLPNGRQIKARYAGHQIDGPCIFHIMQAFIKTASVQDLDTACVEKVQRPAFAKNIPGILSAQ